MYSDEVRVFSLCYEMVEANEQKETISAKGLTCMQKPGFSCLCRLFLVQLDSSGVWLFGLQTAGVNLFLL